MHYAICNIHPFSPYPDPGTTKTQCIMRIMHYNNMHYENFDCMSKGVVRTSLPRRKLCDGIIELACHLAPFIIRLPHN